MNEREYLAAVYGFRPFGPVRTGLLLRYFKNAGRIWNSSVNELKNTGLNEKTVLSFNIYRKKFDPDKYFSALEHYRIKFVALGEEKYPENLKEIIDPPVILYYIGNISSITRYSVAIIGSRKCSNYGREVAYKLSAELSAMGVSIVSGLALGIDAVAHKACIDSKGKGVVVLASGLDTVSPLTNKWIAREVVKHGGVILSEYPLGEPPFRTSFPSRNRIISGLSRAVIVVEGLEKSGTLLTASAAADQGRTVFAVPGPISSPLTFAPHFLIQNGAKLLTSTGEVFRELDWDMRTTVNADTNLLPQDKTEKKILEILTEELHVDELSRLSMIPINQLVPKLTLMELRGLVKGRSGGYYKKP